MATRRAELARDDSRSHRSGDNRLGRNSPLAGGGERPHNGQVEDTEATQLMLEALFDIRAAVFEIHGAVFGDDSGEEEEEDS